MAIEKLNMETKDLSQEHIKQIQQLFPNAVTEINKDGKITLGIDFDVLKQELSNELIDEKQERYQMTWPDKKKAMLLANSKINAALRPLKEKSVDFDNTKNIYIEGDNLDVLKLLRETYLNKVKMIYIDPPYNTGNDFVYEDDFAQSTEEYIANSGQYDEQGNRMVLNNESNGRFHTDWLNMIYPRLKIAKDLLSEDGFIFISLDDNEYSNAIKICNEIFGERNYIASYIKQSKVGGGSDSKYVVKEHEYCFVYCKNIDNAPEMFMDHEKEYLTRYKEKDERGRFFWDTFARPGLKNPIHYDIVTPDGTKLDYGWIHSEERFKKELSEGTVRIIKKNDGNWSVQFKQYLNENGKKPRSMTMDFGGSIDGKNEIKSLFSDDKIFPYPKSIKFISELIKTIKDDNYIIMDFFSGAATTAHTVMKLNAEDDGNRRFIMVQLPEECKDETEAQKLGYKTICDIGEERIRRAGKKIKDELIEKKNNSGMLNDDVIDPDSLDIGFRVFKLDSSNMNDVYYNPNQTQKNLLETTIDNIKLDRTGLDLLFQVMLELGVELSAKIEEKDILGKKCYFVNDTDISACFDDDLTNELLTELAKTKPLYAVFKDSCFNNDSVAINNEQIFKTYSPSTKVKVL